MPFCRYLTWLLCIALVNYSVLCRSNWFQRCQVPARPRQCQGNPRPETGIPVGRALHQLQIFVCACAGCRGKSPSIGGGCYLTRQILSVPCCRTERVCLVRLEGMRVWERGQALLSSSLWGLKYNTKCSHIIIRGPTSFGRAEKTFLSLLGSSSRSAWEMLSSSWSTLVLTTPRNAWSTKRIGIDSQLMTAYLYNMLR